jgi:4-hydroxy-tetrahydrodipicolinate reductase
MIGDFMIKIVVTGAKGKMGQRIIALAKEAGDFEIAGEVDAGDSLEEVLEGADAVIDFSVATAAGKNAEIAAEHGVPIVIGTTGLTPDQEALVKKAAEKTAVIFAPNMSVGVNVMCKIVETASRALGRDYAVDMEETHHVHKVDKPSGTAKRLIEMVKREHPEGVPCRSIREGEVVGDHTVRFSTDFETITISHSAATRDVFAQGALTAARWVAGKPAGLYGMDDVLNLKSQ